MRLKGDADLREHQALRRESLAVRYAADVSEGMQARRSTLVRELVRARAVERDKAVVDDITAAVATSVFLGS